jgi:hopene-associated glycosyltransferase HpnB
MIGLGALVLVIWLYLIFCQGGFWIARETDAAPMPQQPSTWPDVIAVVPARDEAVVIKRSIGSLLGQDYPGHFRIILVDDGSSDGTGKIARDCAERLKLPAKLEVIDGSPPPPRWTGKLWAVARGVKQAGPNAEWLWLTDADIAHDPECLRELVARAVAEDLVLNSLMAKLRCDSLAERALVPAFVLFFQMLYPFARVNDPASKVAAAAGGCILVRKDAFDRAGGVATIASAIIDDCAVGVMMKKQGRVRLSLTHRSASIRPYGSWREIGAMIARSAYAQLSYSPLLLVGTILGMALVFLAPPLLTVFGHGPARWLAAIAWLLMAFSFQPMLHFYRRSPFWALALPGIAAFYGGATFMSAVQHWQGRGGMWKGRAQAQLSR